MENIICYNYYNCNECQYSKNCECQEEYLFINNKLTFIESFNKAFSSEEIKKYYNKSQNCEKDDCYSCNNCGGCCNE
jgi:hypothetical protein